jgi:hypothetical protein
LRTRSHPRLFVTDRGVGEPVLLITGWTISSAVFDPIADLYLPHVRVIAYDGALHTASDASDSLFTIGLGSLAVESPGPAVLALARPTPNPSRAPASLHFSLPREGRVRLEILDLSGRRVWDTEGLFGAGTHTAVWDGRRADGGTVEPGLYFIRLATPWGARTDRMVRLR